MEKVKRMENEREEKVGKGESPIKNEVRANGK